MAYKTEEVSNDLFRYVLRKAVNVDKVDMKKIAAKFNVHPLLVGLWVEGLETPSETPSQQLACEIINWLDDGAE